MGSGRASKKLIVHQHKLPSSVYAVMSNDDLLIEILVRLPIFSILVFKTVSKRWFSLITGHVSTLRCSQNQNVDPPCGLFLQRYIDYDSIYNYVALDTRFLVNRSHSLIMNATNRFGFPYNGKAEILQSCNGLLLCARYSDKLYVYNLSINRFKMLPPCCNYSGLKVDYTTTMRLAFDPIKSPYYKIVFAGTKHDDVDYIQIQTYSSETGTWSICPNQFPKSDFSQFHHTIYWNNALHWICDEKKHVKLDVEHLVLTSVQTLHVLGHCKLFESRGCLLLVGEYTDHTDHTRHLAIYEMRKGYSRWSMKYLVNRDDIKNLFTKTTGVQPTITMGCYRVQCIVLGEKEKDSFLVLEICGMVVQYKIESKTMRGLYDVGPESLHTALYRGCYQLYASFASV